MIVLEILTRDLFNRACQILSAKFLFCLIDYLIVHICDIPYKVNLITFICKITADNIKYISASGMADMGDVVNSRTADIHADMAFFDRPELFFFSCKRIVYFDTHCLLPFLIAELRGSWPSARRGNTQKLYVSFQRSSALRSA